ncbi:hypothetical protein [Tropicimonas sp. IMCC34043]|uniref:hypothetical protein n=1 Tax=Tropicimonas sp. IMCC34043 TaxID=2248760 RepID=UPI000E24FD2C|nr:hypothetical protein [Tropicimonas sp. IMCC34043]
MADPRFCACCTGPVIPAPAVIFNRPGLSQIAYRIGSFATFRQAMLQQIHRSPELIGFLTRESDDHGVTLIELCAALGDVLSFYNERIANELYLGQALHKASVEQLVALLGYVPRPSLSATGLLAFEIEDGKATRLWRGLKVMSVPGPDETAQVFETLEEIRGTGRLNAAPAFGLTRAVNALAGNSRRAPVVADPNLKSGARIVIFGRDVTEEKTLGPVETNAGGTYLSWTPAVQATNFHPRFVRAVPVARRLNFFGHTAPSHENVYRTDPTIAPQNRWTSQPVAGNFAAGTVDYPLSGRIEDLDTGAHLLLDAGAGVVPRLQTARVVATSTAQAVIGQTAETVTHVRVRQTITGRPTLAVVGLSTVVLARNGGGHPVWLGDIAAPQPLAPVHATPFFAASDIATAEVGTTFHLYLRDAATRLRKAVWSGGGWSAWADFGGLIDGAPVPVVLPGGQVRVFVRGADLRLWMFDTTGGPVAPADLGGVLMSAPTAVAPGGGSLAVFVRGLDDALWMRGFDGAVWQDWERIGGRIDGTPAAVTSGGGRIDVFARDRDGGLVLFRRTGAGWQAPRNLGGDVAGDPSATAGAPDWTAVSVRTSQDRLAWLWRIGETVSPWADVGGAIASDPSMASGPFVVAAAARHQDGSIATRVLFPPMPDWVRHGDGFSAIPDRREARLFEIGDDIDFRSFDYPPATEGGFLTLPLRNGEAADDPEGLGALKPGRKLLISGRGLLHRAEVTATLPVAAVPGGPVDHLNLAVTPPLPRTAGPLTVQGNIADASHGETQREEAIGNGDAGRAWQVFAVPPGEISHLPLPTSTRPQPQVELRVDGVLWKEVASLYGRSSKDRAYTLSLPDDANPAVRGGDGARAGARFPTGALNLRLTRRLGAGPAGNLRAGQLSIPLEKPVGMKTVANPFATSGGAAGEIADDARRAAPNRVRTFGRIVSLQDFAALATASGLAARAHVTWVWNRMERTAHLTVAGPGGAPIPAETLRLIHAQLGASRDPNRPLMIAGMVRVPIVIAAALLRDPAWRAEDVMAGGRAALEAAFGFDTRGIGAAVHLSDIFAILQGVAGVRAVDVNLLHLKDHADLTAAERSLRSVTSDPVQPHIRLFAARPLPATPSEIDRYQARAYLPGPVPAVLPAEQAFIEDPAGDISLTVVEEL